MTEPAPPFEASRAASKLLVLIIPSADRHQKPIAQDFWLEQVLSLLAVCFGGATALPKGRGVWRDDAQGGRIVQDEPILIHCYTTQEALTEHLPAVHALVMRMGQETNQGAVAYVVDGVYFEFSLPPSREAGSGEVA
jgi:hypothetical protein